jgi:hypothetical protein
MMTHDPFQNFQTPGGYFGAPAPFGLPYTAYQPPFNPMGVAQLGPLQQLLALNSLAAGLQSPFLQHPQAQGPWQNPQLGYQGWPQQQQPYGYPQQQQQTYGYPQAQQQNLTGYPLAPQSLIGAGGIGQPFGQIHPLAQLALRQAAGYGISPLAGGF